jgi:hypothetical protein
MNETLHFHIYDDEGLKMAKASLNMLPKQYILLQIHKIKFVLTVISFICSRNTMRCLT